MESSLFSLSNSVISSPLIVSWLSVFPEVGRKETSIYWLLLISVTPILPPPAGTDRSAVDPSTLKDWLIALLSLLASSVQRAIKNATSTSPVPNVPVKVYRYVVSSILVAAPSTTTPVAAVPDISNSSDASVIDDSSSVAPAEGLYLISR